MKGVIYCRVSSKEQVKGTSLESQELACREYAERNHITVSKVFIEKGESAKCADRTQLLELLDFCRRRENAIHVLLVWKVDRLARNVGDHFNIKASLMKFNIRVVSVTEPIDENPEGKLLETILAGFAQFDNDIRATRTLNGMQLKIQEGLCPWKAPLGYKSAIQPGDKKTQPDIPDQPLFRLLQRAWQEFATGTYTKAEILRAMKSWGIRTRRGLPLSKQSLDEMFNDRFYAGVIRDPWSGAEYPGRHIPLVSRELFAKVQEVIRRRANSARHVQVRPELPLRMFARCFRCTRYVTGSLSRGRSQYYPYYRCFSRDCDNPANYKTQLVHEEFMEFLNSMTPSPSSVQGFREAIVATTQSRAAANRILAERRNVELRRLTQQQEQLIQMKMDNLLTAEEFLAQKGRITGQRQEIEASRYDDGIEQDEASVLLDEICDPIMNLSATWIDISISLKQRFQRSILPNGFVVGRVRTANVSDLFSTFWEFERSKSGEVARDGRIWNQIIRELREFSRIIRLAQEGPTSA